MKYKIMIVEDSKVAFASMEHFLQDSDIEVCCHCQSGEEALSTYDQFMPDLVTMDIVMPGMDGMEAAAALLARWPGARVVMVSAMAYDDTILMAKEMGVKDFLYKPFRQQELVDCIHRALAD